jgi:hypothetical protein
MPGTTVTGVEQQFFPFGIHVHRQRVNSLAACTGVRFRQFFAHLSHFLMKSHGGINALLEAADPGSRCTLVDDPLSEIDKVDRRPKDRDAGGDRNLPKVCPSDTPGYCVRA